MRPVPLATGSTGAMLSGGLDSSSVACVAAGILRTERGLPLPTSSLVFDATPANNERPYVESSSGWRRVRSEAPASTFFPVFADFDHILSEQDGPFLAPGLAISRQLYAQAAQRGIRVLPNGGVNRVGVRR